MLRVYRIVLFVFLYPAMSVPGSADISAMNFGGSYQIKVTDPIKPGDYQTLVATIEKEGRFPDSVQIESDRGDITESMQIGRLARRGMLSATAGKTCASSCFLIWVGAVHRNTTTDVFDVTGVFEKVTGQPAHAKPRKSR